MSTAPTPEPKKLSSHYKNMQLAYMACAAGLFCWRFLGATLEMPKINALLTTQTALPYIWSAGLIFLGYRVTVEWNECDGFEVAKRLSKYDFWVTHLFAATILILVVQQLVSLKRFGRISIPHHGKFFALSVGLTLLSSASIFGYRALKALWAKMTGAVLLGGLLFLTMWVLAYTARTEGTLTAISAFIIGTLPLVVFGVVVLLFFVLFILLFAYGWRSTQTDDDDTPDLPYTLGGY